MEEAPKPQQENSKQEGNEESIPSQETQVPKRGWITRLYEWSANRDPTAKYKSFRFLFRLVIPACKWGGGIAIAIIFSIPGRIPRSSGNFFTGVDKYGWGVTDLAADILTMIVWFFIFLLGFIAYLNSRMKDLDLEFARKERQQKGEQDLEGIKKDYSKKLDAVVTELKTAATDIQSAQHNTPNPKVFGAHQRIVHIDFEFAQKTLYGIEKEATTEADRFETYKRGLQYRLKNICKLAREFSKLDSSHIYGANIMLYVHNSGETTSKIMNWREARPWVYLAHYDLKEIRGILVSIDELIFHSDIEGENRIVPGVALPVLNNPTPRTEIPGACKAARCEVDNIVINNVLAENIYGDEVREVGLNFFKGPGSSIRSMVSMHIPLYGYPEREAAKFGHISGILNIDCNKEYLLGIEEKYAGTFIALLRPIAYSLARDVTAYRELYLSKSS